VPAIGKFTKLVLYKGKQMGSVKLSTIKKIKENYEKEYIPSGTPRIKYVFNLFKAESLQAPFDFKLLMRCCCPIGFDVQSGPYFCGESASLLSIIDNNSFIFVCEKHEYKLRNMYLDAFEGKVS
jgi:hypothetical protein